VPLAPAAAPAPSPFLAALTESLESADAFALDARLRRAVALERGRLAQMGPLLLELASGARYRDLGFTSLDAYARERLGMAPRTARALLRVERAGCSSPPLAAAWRSGTLSGCQAQALVALVLTGGSGPWIPAWIERAGRVTLRRLEDDLDHALATGNLAPAALPALPEPPPLDLAASCAEAPAGVQYGARPMHWGERNRVRIHAPADVIRLLRACLATVQRRIERRANRPSTPGEALEAILDHALETWSPARPPCPLPFGRRRRRAREPDDPLRGARAS
jgi:hypothetical protein